MSSGKVYQIWIEGYAATGERSPAHYYGQIEANTFDEAVIAVFGIEKLDKDEKQPDGLRRSANGHLMCWACRFFDNEKDARASFG